MKNTTSSATWKIEIKGLVQGVGFRPFVFKLAIDHLLKGYVTNRNDCVVIKVQGERNAIDDFVIGLRENAPPASMISSIDVEKLDEEEIFADFKINPSENISSSITEISPDIAVCKDCLNDLKIQEHRQDYPFINCTHCGPRFTIIKDLPYDRENTTMSPFIMCDRCSREYKDVWDRRFHAQPVACSHCGPHYELYRQVQQEDGTYVYHHSPTGILPIIETIKSLLQNGGIVAIKGMGGYHLACDATNAVAVENLRQKKGREGKPFAVMFRSLETAKEYVYLDQAEEDTLTSWQRPIVLLKEKRRLAPGVTNGFRNIGALLPYMPFHYLLFEKMELPAIVLTSGNLSDEPIIIGDGEALERFKGIVDGVLTYNRTIFNRVDDSVAVHMNGSKRMIRRSRGYAPASIGMSVNVEGIFAAGAELVNCFCIGKGNKAYLSQHIGDLKNLETYQFYTESFDRFRRMFRLKPDLVVHDLHPDYLSTRFTREMDVPSLAVQHHHAHIASCMAENGIDEEVIGVSFDGTGLGTDGNIWGGELMLCSLSDFKRMGHLEYVPMPGGDKAAHEPWRMALSYLNHAFEGSYPEQLGLLNSIDKSRIALVTQSIRQGINAPLTSSAGRLFDAVSAILSICHYASFYAEAPMRLETAIAEDEVGEYPFEISHSGIISFKATIREIVADVSKKNNTSIIASRFHNTIISAIFSSVNRIRSESEINKVALSGGVFQNRFLSEKAEQKLQRNGFEVYVQKKVPANDGGLALGQLAIAAKKRLNGEL